MNKVSPVILSDCRRQFPNELASVVRTGFGRVIVHRDQGTGAAKATKRAIESAHKAYQSAHILFLEDDVLLHPAFCNAIRRIIFPNNVGVISFGDWRELPSKTSDGLYVKNSLGCDGRGWQGNQAMLIHCDVVCDLIQKDWFSEKIENTPGVKGHKEYYLDHGLQCSDLRISMIVSEHQTRNMYAVHAPALALHVGHKSMCFPDREPILGERETRNYPKDSWAVPQNNLYSDLLNIED